MAFARIRHHRRKVKKAAWRRQESGQAVIHTRSAPRRGAISFMIERDVVGSNYGAAICYGKSADTEFKKRVLKGGYTKPQKRCGFGRGASPSAALRKALHSLARVTR